jgi:hypothetical protein
MELARLDITVQVRWKAGCERDSCAMRRIGR